MSNIIKDVTSIVDREVEVAEIKQEISALVKMLKLGFEKKTNGIEKPAKVYATADEKKLAKYYDSIANQIKGIASFGSLDKFADYMYLNHNIKMNLPDVFPTMAYAKSKKKSGKFKDLYSGYFLEDVPRKSEEALNKIVNSINKLTKTFTDEATPIKEDFKLLIEAQTEYSPITIKLLEKVLRTAKMKDLTIEDATSDVDSKLDLQQMAITLLEKKN
jgi:hypothetical protein